MQNLATPRSSPARTAILLASAFLIVAGLRIPGLFTDFWWDEIWSWSIAGQLHSAIGVLLAEPAHIDNNHPLNTLWLYLLGQNQPIWLYRLPALIAGIASVGLAARIMLRRGVTEAVIATVLLGCSYLLIFYSSEARGYSFAVFFSLLSFDYLQRALKPEGGGRVAEIMFGLSCTLGLLSHLTFLNIYAGALVWSMVCVRRLEPTTWLRIRRLMRLHAIPLIAAALLFHFFVRGMVIGGALPTSPGAVLLQTLSLAAGGPETGRVALLTAIIAGLLFFAGLVYLAMERSSSWIFFLTSVVIAPVLASTRDLCFTLRPQPLMLRYFLVCIAMALFSVVPLLAYLWRRGLAYRVVVALFLALYVGGNLFNVGQFLKSGRGGYGEGLAEIAAQVPGSTFAIASDSLPHTDLLVQFYAPRVAPRRHIRVTSTTQSWLILNRLEQIAPATAEFNDQPYHLKYIHAANGLSGWTWEIYAADNIDLH